MKFTAYLTLDEVLVIHNTLIERFGGTGGVRDLGIVESALARARSGYYQTLCEQAAALLQSLIMGHAFVDGNKRVGFTACAVFLRMNGYRLSVRAADAERFITRNVIEKHADLHHIAEWLEKKIVSTDP